MPAVDGLTALGVTSEVARLLESERHLVLNTVMEQVNGRVPVVAGTTAESLRACIEYTRAAQRAGAAAAMVSPPRMLKLNSEAVFREPHKQRSFHCESRHGWIDTKTPSKKGLGVRSPSSSRYMHLHGPVIADMGKG
jgi:hypothetical protein